MDKHLEIWARINKALAMAKNGQDRGNIYLEFKREYLALFDEGEERDAADKRLRRITAKRSRDMALDYHNRVRMVAA